MRAEPILLINLHVVLETRMLYASLVVSAETGGNFGDSVELKPARLIVSWLVS